MKHRRRFVMQVTSPLAVLYSTSTMEHHHFDQADSSPASPLTNGKFRLQSLFMRCRAIIWVKKLSSWISQTTQTIVVQTDKLNRVLRVAHNAPLKKFELLSASGPILTAHKSQFFHLCSHTKIKYIFLLKTIAYPVFSPLSDYVSYTR